MDEEKLIEIVKPYLDKCRPGDYNHALRVVKWVKILGRERDDLELLITAAYIHDIGWFNILPREKIDFKEMLTFEEQANKNTGKLVPEVLKKLGFSKENIYKIISLIQAADNHESKSEDEAIIVDADNLSKLCVEHVKEKYSPDSYTQVISLWEEKFPIRIKTEKGKEIYPDLLNDLKKKLL